MLPQQFTGTLVRDRFAAGSKSERLAVLLVTGENRYVLRRQGGNAFQDPALDQLVGKRVRCTGTVAGCTLLLTAWTKIPAS